MISRTDLINNIENLQPNWTILSQFRWVVIDINKNAICMSPASFPNKGACKRDYKKFKREYFAFENYKDLKVEFNIEFRWYIISMFGRVVSSSNLHFDNIHSCKNDALEHGLNHKNRIIDDLAPNFIQLLNDWS